MYNIKQESFVKLIQRTDIKDYLFYLTYNNRARIIEEEIQEDKRILSIKDKYKKEILQELPKEKQITNKFIKTNTSIIEYKNNLQFNRQYNKSLKEEGKGVIGGIKSIEMIMSFSIEFNKLMKDLMGEDLWQIEYEYRVVNLIKRNLKNKHHISFFHKMTSNGYRLHNHTLLYPYELSSNGLYVPQHMISKEKLEEIKKEFNNEARELIEINKDKIHKKSEKKPEYKKYMNII